MLPWILSIALALALLFLLWLFLIAPKKPRGPQLAPFCDRAYAHRGLWGEGAPENSLAAFARAAEKGFAIELDVQLSRDGTVMVFHDYTLDRMCTKEGRLSDFTAAELGNIPLNGAENQTIPTLREVLESVAGRVPLLIELKGESGDTALCPKLLETLADYKGAWCVESFNPLLLQWFRKNAPHVLRGLLWTDLGKEKRNGSPLVNFLLTRMWLNVVCRPHFIAWDHKYPRGMARVLCHRLGAASFVVTIKDAAAYRNFLDAGTAPIFDEFVPEK